jgi:hypothetical protein
MASKPRDTSFSFGALEGSSAGKPATSTSKGSGGKRKLSRAQRETARFYMNRKRR